MSTPLPHGFDLESARHFNSVHTSSMAWRELGLPQKVVEKYPQLTADPGSEAFALGTVEVQRALFGDESKIDGKFGTGTQKAVLREYDYVPDDASYVLHNRARRRISERDAYHVSTFEDGLDLHRSGWHRDRRRDIRFIVLHWGGTSLESCYRALTNRNLSSHFGIKGNHVHQWLDCSLVAYHGGHANTHSIGIDICQQPTTKWLDRYLEEGLDVEVVSNPTSRGHSEIVTLDSAAVRATRALLEELCELYSIPFRVPRGSDGLETEGPFWHGVFDREKIREGAYHGILGHHHVSKQKWDVAPWWRQIFDERKFGA